MRKYLYLFMNSLYSFSSHSMGQPHLSWTVFREQLEDREGKRGHFLLRAKTTWLLSEIQRMLRGEVTSLQKYCRKQTWERKKRAKLALA